MTQQQVQQRSEQAPGTHPARVPNPRQSLRPEPMRALPDELRRGAQEAKGTREVSAVCEYGPRCFEAYVAGEVGDMSEQGLYSQVRDHIRTHGHTVQVDDVTWALRTFAPKD